MARTRQARGGVVSLALGALLAAMILPVSSPAASAADEVRCGMTVTEDLTLEADLFCDDQHQGTWAALTVAASGVTVDLNGYTVSSGGSFVLCGVDTHGADDVVVRNGTITGFNRGLYFDGTSGLLLEHLTVNGVDMAQPGGPGTGIAGSVDNAVIRSNTVWGSAISLAVVGSNNVISGNSLIENYGGLGVSGDWNVVDSNTVADGFQGMSVSGSHNTVTGNEITAWEGSEEWAVGIWVREGSSDNTISSNALTGGRFGVYVGHPELTSLSQRNRIEGNVISRSDVAIGVSGHAVDTDVTANEVTATRIGILVSGADHTTVAHNTVTGSLEDGLVVEVDSTSTVVIDNQAHHNGSTDGPWDGIDIYAADTTVTGNTTNHNARYGISAVPGVTDGGGNWADHNRSPTGQCLNITCQSSTPTTTTTQPTTTTPPPTAPTTTTPSTTPTTHQPTTIITTAPPPKTTRATTQPPTSTVPRTSIHTTIPAPTNTVPAEDTASGPTEAANGGSSPWWAPLVVLAGAAGVVAAVIIRRRTPTPPTASTEKPDSPTLIDEFPDGRSRRHP